MRNYKKQFFWENLHHSRLLLRYESLVNKYFSQVDIYRFEVADTEQSLTTRRELNMILGQISQTIRAAKITPVMSYSDPPAIGGRRFNIDVISNMFNLARFDMDKKQILDFVQVAIGVYRKDLFNSLLRSINPFFWLLLVIEAIVRVPFLVLGSAGLDGDKLEGSILGKLTKGILTFVTFALTSAWIAVQIADKLGVLNQLKTVLKISK